MYLLCVCAIGLYNRETHLRWCVYISPHTVHEYSYSIFFLVACWLYSSYAGFCIIAFIHATLLLVNINYSAASNNTNQPLPEQL